MNELVDAAQRASFQLSRAGSSKLRRMTRASGLSSENIVSRVAIIRSLAEPLANNYADEYPAGDGKEMKGLTLLGRTRPAALVLAMVAEHADRALDQDEAKALIRYHWERGLALLSRDCPDGNVTDWFARRVLDASDVTPEHATTGAASRDVIAAAVGRRYGRWPIEVRRLAALGGRLNLAAANEFADRLAARAEELEPGARVSEAIALRVMRELGLSRLGLNKADRKFLSLVAEGASLPVDEVAVRDRPALVFLSRLNLVDARDGQVRLTATAERLGKELWQL